GCRGTPAVLRGRPQQDSPNLGADAWLTFHLHPSRGSMVRIHGVVGELDRVVRLEPLFDVGHAAFIIARRNAQGTAQMNVPTSPYSTNSQQGATPGSQALSCVRRPHRSGTRAAAGPPSRPDRRADRGGDAPSPRRRSAGGPP